MKNMDLFLVNYSCLEEPGVHTMIFRDFLSLSSCFQADYVECERMDESVTESLVNGVIVAHLCCTYEEQQCISLL